MQVTSFIQHIENLGIKDYIGVPDSTLKCFCDYLNRNISNSHHFIPVNEGAAVALASGIYLGEQKISCVYMQNSGIGNACNPMISLINKKVYDIPMLFVIGYRGEVGIKDEPQHKFQGEITIPMMECLQIPHAVIGKDTTKEELENIFSQANKQLLINKQFAIIVRKDTFEPFPAFIASNAFTLVREEAIKEILQSSKEQDVIVSTTGKISREVYEQCNALFHNHDRVFLTVGSMGHASMIALGIALKNPNRRVYCIDGDGATLMHMGALAFIAKQACKNFIHITLNNEAHESVGGMPTNCRGISFSQIAKTCGYLISKCVSDIPSLREALNDLKALDGPSYLEVQVALFARDDLGRPKESAIENKQRFMQHIAEWR